MTKSAFKAGFGFLCTGKMVPVVSWVLELLDRKINIIKLLCLCSRLSYSRPFLPSIFYITSHAFRSFYKTMTWKRHSLTSFKDFSDLFGFLAAEAEMFCSKSALKNMKNVCLHPGIPIGPASCEFQAWAASPSMYIQTKSGRRKWLSSFIEQ